MESMEDLQLGEWLDRAAHPAVSEKHIFFSGKTRLLLLDCSKLSAHFQTTSGQNLTKTNLATHYHNYKQELKCELKLQERKNKELRRKS